MATVTATIRREGTAIPVLNPAVLRFSLDSFDEPLLHLDRTGDGIHRAGELPQGTVTCGFDQMLILDL